MIKDFNGKFTAFLPKGPAEYGRALASMAPGAYTICWCRGECLSPSSFQATAGDITLQGPALGQAVECARGSACTVMLTGEQLEAGEMIRVVLGDCSQDTAWDSVGNSTSAIPEAFTFPRVQARAGIYKVTESASYCSICFCKARSQVLLSISRCRKQ